MAELRSVTFRCRGHPDIRGSHHKSIEFTRDVGITQRATCVLGVAAEVDPGALPGLRGPLSICLQGGGRAEVVRAVANPGYEPGDRMVIRTSRHASPDTLAVDADKGADRIDRELLAQLASSETSVTVTLAEEPAAGRPAYGQLTVIAIPELHPGHLTPAIREALTAAEVVLAAEPRPVAAMLAGADVEAPVHDAGSVTDGDLRAQLRADERLAYVVAAGHRGDEGSGADPLTRLADAVADAEAAVRVVPAPPPELAARVVGGSALAPYTLVGHPTDPQSRAGFLEAAAVTGANLVWGESPASLPAALAGIDDAGGQRRVRVGVGVHAPQGLVLRGTATEVRRQWDELCRPPGEVVVVVVEGGERLGGADARRLDPLLAALLAEGVSSRSIARALGSLPGHDYRSEYRRVLALKSGRGE